MSKHKSKPSGLKLYNSDVPDKEDIFVAKKFDKQFWTMGDLGAARLGEEGELIDSKPFDSLGQKSMEQLIENEWIYIEQSHDICDGKYARELDILEDDDVVISKSEMDEILQKFVLLKLFACQQGEYGNILELLERIRLGRWDVSRHVRMSEEV